MFLPALPARTFLDALSVEMSEVSGVAGQQIVGFPVNRG